jgi:hypothetical protein
VIRYAIAWRDRASLRNAASRAGCRGVVEAMGSGTSAAVTSRAVRRDERLRASLPRAATRGGVESNALARGHTGTRASLCPPARPEARAHPPTTGIQGLDLVGRKPFARGDATLATLRDEVSQRSSRNDDDPGEGSPGSRRCGHVVTSCRPGSTWSPASHPSS